MFQEPVKAQCWTVPSTKCLFSVLGLSESKGSKWLKDLIIESFKVLMFCGKHGGWKRVQVMLDQLRGCIGGVREEIYFTNQTTAKHAACILQHPPTQGHVSHHWYICAGSLRYPSEIWWQVVKLHCCMIITVVCPPMMCALQYNFKSHAWSLRHQIQTDFALLVGLVNPFSVRTNLHEVGSAFQHSHVWTFTWTTLEEPKPLQLRAWMELQACWVPVLALQLSAALADACLHSFCVSLESAASFLPHWTYLCVLLRMMHTCTSWCSFSLHSFHISTSWSFEWTLTSLTKTNGLSNMCKHVGLQRKNYDAGTWWLYIPWKVRLAVSTSQAAAWFGWRSPHEATGHTWSWHSFTPQVAAIHTGCRRLPRLKVW